MRALPKISGHCFEVILYLFYMIFDSYLKQYFIYKNIFSINSK